MKIETETNENSFNEIEPTILHSTTMFDSDKNTASKSAQLNDICREKDMTYNQCQ